MKPLGLLIALISLGATNCAQATLAKAETLPQDAIKATFHYVPVAPEKVPSFVGDVYFSRSYFEHPSTEYDPHLATASLAMVISTFTDFGPFDETWYQSQSKYVEEYFGAIGFNGFTVNDDYKKSATFDSLGLAAAKKEMGSYTIVAITPRSGGYFREWANNMHLGDGSKSDMMHEGWYNAANKILSFLDNYVTSNNVTGRVKLWMSGFSRGGAATNIAAALIDNKLSKGEKIFSNEAYATKEDVYAYTFEAPQGANVYSKSIKAPKDALYNNIFNIVNPLDVVPKLAMKQYGFTRFGIDKYITTKFYDPSNYAEKRRSYTAFHDIFNQNKDVTIDRSDAFTMGGFEINFLGGDILAFLFGNLLSDNELYEWVEDLEDDTKVNYDANIATSILLEELVARIGSRDDYVRDYQTSLESVMLLVQNEACPVATPMKALIKTVLISSVVKAVLGNTDKAKSSMKQTWGDDIGEELSKLTDALIGPVASIYWERPNELLSVAGFVPFIIQNHYPDFVFAHLASQDSYYIDAYNEGKPSNEKISVASFFDNADYGRMKFFGYNDIGLRLDNKDGRRVVSIDGHYLGKSDVKSCEQGYAAAYYSYATEEKMELYMPVGRTYNISMQSYSKKPSHRCEYWAYYEYFSPDNSGRVQVEVGHYKENVKFASDRHKFDVAIVK